MEKLRCAMCRVWTCSTDPGTKEYPPFCPMPTETAILSRAEEVYLSQDGLREFALAAARTEAAGYCKEPRVEEIMNFARRIGARRLGIASCIGLIREARLLQEILEANGFEVDSVCCKVGSIDKLELPVGVVINREGVGDRGVEDYCAAEDIPILIRIPLDRRIAEAYSEGVMMVEALPEYRERFVELYRRIEEEVAR